MPETVVIRTVTPEEANVAVRFVPILVILNGIQWIEKNEIPLVQYTGLERLRNRIEDIELDLRVA